MPRPDLRSREAERDRRRRNEQPWRRLYKTARWASVRDAQLARKPLCEWCKARGLIVEAEVCHHNDPNTKNSPTTFYQGPFTSLCAACHDGPAQRMEKTGRMVGSDINGRPIDPSHPWNA